MDSPERSLLHRESSHDWRSLPRKGDCGVSRTRILHRASSRDWRSLFTLWILRSGASFIEKALMIGAASLARGIVGSVALGSFTEQALVIGAASLPYGFAGAEPPSSRKLS